MKNVYIFISAKITFNGVNYQKLLSVRWLKGNLYNLYIKCEKVKGGFDF